MPGIPIAIVRIPNPGSNGRKPQEKKRKKRKTHLTHTGQLMEGLAALSE
jgi:hypothetical protein